MLRDTADSASTLRALASHDWKPELLSIDDDTLRLIRDAFASLGQQLQQQLGPAVGRVISVDIQRWDGSKRVTTSGTPARAYLPASIEDRKDGWSKAAGRTKGLSWIHPRYEDVLRRSGRQRAGSTGPRPLAARALFGLLGAEVAPRLAARIGIETRYNDPANPIALDSLAAPQIEGLRAMTRHATHLKGDRLSPDLLAALKDIQCDRGLRARRARARALLTTLEREWDRLYAPHTKADAVFSYGSWRQAGTIPASWLANAMDEPWLTSEDRKKKAPRRLAVRTPATEAILGDDRSLFAYELDESDAASPAIRALRIQTDPQVSEMVDQLTRLRDEGGSVDKRSVMLYAAIGANCKKSVPAPDDRIGDLRMRTLRARFGTQPNRPGLIYANGRWLAPSKVLLGAPIFGHRRSFVSERSAAERLWRALRIPLPSVTDCIDVLHEIARGIPEKDDEQVLVNTYRYLESHLQNASRQEQSRLGNIPLWDGAAWRADRPVFVVADEEVAEALSSRVVVWRLPVAATAVPKLIAAANTTLLAEHDFDPLIREQSFIEGATVERQFGAAVELLRDWLTRHDPGLFEALSTTWEELALAQIAIDPGLQIELRLSRRAQVSVPTRAHLIRSPLTLYFTDSEAIGEDVAGGRVIASLFTGGDSDKLALVWSRSWDKAAKGERGAVTLVQDSGNEQALLSLFEQAKGSTPTPKRTPAKQARQIAITTTTERALPVRRLKRIEDLSEKLVEVSAGDNQAAGKQSPRRGLRKDIPPGKRIGDSRPAPYTAPLAYSEEEREDLALQILQVAINGDSVELRDYRHLRGVGADALDNLRRYFEIKAAYGSLPNDFTLTADEAKRAFLEGDKFFLAVVAGLEEGYETIVKVFPNPLRTLELKPNTSVTLSGIRDRGAALVVRFPASGDGGLETVTEG